MELQDLSKLRIERPIGGHRDRPRLRRWIISGMLSVAVVVAAGVAYRMLASEPAVEVTTVITVYPSQALTVLNATGYVVAQRKAAVATKATGRLEWLGVAEGSHVKQDDIIARLENKDVTAQQEQAAANVKVAQANLQQGYAELREAEAALRRSQELAAKRFISASAHDTAIARAAKARAAIDSLKAAVIAAEANLKAARIAVEQTLIRAPFEGVVLTKQANVGDIVTPFSSAVDSKGAVVTMADMSTLEVEADVAESSLSKIRIGQPCEIQLDALPDLRFMGTLDRTVPTVDRSKATLLVKIRFSEIDKRILPEMSAKVAFLEKELSAQQREPVTAVHPGAVVRRDGRSMVFSLKENKVTPVSVTTGASIGDSVSIQGVPAGTKVVLHAPEDLKDGASVKLRLK